MDAAATHERTGTVVGARLPALDLAGAANWLVGLTPVAYLGLRGGGYDPLVHTGVAIVVWWAVLIGVAVGALSTARTGLAGRVALGAGAGLAALTVASVAWSDSPDGAAGESARVLLYLGVLALAVLAPRRPGSTRMLLSGVASAIVLVAVAALVSRLQLTGDGSVNGTTRLSAPLNYWNGLGALMVIGVPVLLGLARSCRRTLTQAAAAAPVPLLVLVVYLTGSRGGVVALGIGLVAFLVLTGDRLAALASIAVAGAGSALLVATANRHGDLLPGAARDTDGFVATLVVVLLGTLLMHLAASTVTRYAQRPSWMTPSPRRTAAGLAAGLVAIVVVLAASGTPSYVGDRWDEFTRAPSADVQALTTSTNVLERLGYATGIGRYQMWQQAGDLFTDRPLLGHGAGSFEARWAQNRPADSVFARNAHSLFMETLGTLGLVGTALLALLLLAMLGAGLVALARRTTDDRPLVAAALAGLLAFLVSASADWVWQIPVVAVTALLVGSTLLSDHPPGPTRRGATALRAGTLVIAILAIGGLALSLTATTNLRRSRDEATQGRLVAAAQSAATAAAVEPFASDPQTQLALILERSGQLSSAASHARTATELEPTNWSTWYVLARIEARNGNAPAALAAFSRARTLNPRSPVLTTR